MDKTSVCARPASTASDQQLSSCLCVSVMWRIIVTVTLLCCSSEASVTCRNESNHEVDWFIIYKAPKQGKELTGVEYLYMDSEGRAEQKKLINDPLGVLANTLRPLFTPIRNMAPDFGFISYSDQPPGSQSDDTFGHSKGVVMVNKTGTGVWILHSTPQFPFRRDQNKFWPNSGNKNAQTFICVTFPYDQFKQIGQHLLDIRAFPFDHDVPLDFHQTLQQAVKWEQASKDLPPPPPADFKELKSAKGQMFFSIAKNLPIERKPGQKIRRDDDKMEDLYFTIANHPKVQGDLTVKTWRCKKYSNIDCGDKYKLYNAVKLTITTVMGTWESGSDHSKWCVSRDQNKHWTCIADVNRSQSQFERRGGALCINKEEVATRFRRFKTAEDCLVEGPQDGECEKEPK